MKIDKQNKNVAFSEKEHCYWNVNDNKKYIICKSTGYGAFIKLFPYIFNIGNDRKTLDEEFFKEVFRVIQSKFNESHLEFTSEYFPSNEDQQRKLAEKMKEFLEDSYYRF